MTNKQKILVSVPFYVILAAVMSFVVGFVWAIGACCDAYKEDESVSDMWSELDPTS